MNCNMFRHLKQLKTKQTSNTDMNGFYKTTLVKLDKQGPAKHNRTQNKTRQS